MDDIEVRNIVGTENWRMFINWINHITGEENEFGEIDFDEFYVKMFRSMLDSGYEWKEDGRTPTNS